MQKIPYQEMIRESTRDFKIQTRIYRDPVIFEDEIRNIFERTWVYVGHESELSQPGDYRTTSIGNQPVIISRDSDERIHALLNVCRHRGNAVCRGERGNSSFFRCPYHGWVYSNSGALVAVTEQSGYSEGFAKDTAGLIRVPRVSTYRGLIFASLNSDVEILDEYLGDVKKYIDLWVDRSPIGKVKVLHPHKFVYHGNWKFQAENGADGYHPSFVHESAFATRARFGFRSGARAVPGASASSMGFKFGHCWLAGAYWPTLPPGLFEEYRDSLVSHHGAERVNEIMRNRHVLIFPNLYLMDVNLRVIRPVSVNKTIVYSYYTDLEGVSEEVNKARLRDVQGRLGTTGSISPDDMEMFAANQTGIQASSMEWLILSRGLQREVIHPTGEREALYSDETPQRAIYREWLRLMDLAGSEGAPENDQTRGRGLSICRGTPA